MQRKLQQIYICMAVLHLKQKNQPRRDLYRIFVYDCPPLTKKAHNPISNNSIDFSKTDIAQFRLKFHDELRSKRLVALRLGHLSKHAKWNIHPHRLKEVFKGTKKFEDLNEDDVFYQARQKGVDMKLGVDIASLAYKKLVNQIVLIAGDADFIPAAKLARREGIDFILDPMRQLIDPALNEHVDGLRTTAPAATKT